MRLTVCLDWKKRMETEKMKVNEHQLPLFENIKWRGGKVNEPEYFTLILFIFKRRGKWEKKTIFNSSPFTFSPSPLVIYSNKVNANHLAFLPLPSITFHSPPLPFSYLFQSKQSVKNRHSYLKFLDRALMSEDNITFLQLCKP